MSDRKTGTVKKWLNKGFGFISCDQDEQEYFVHFNSITEPAGCKAIKVGSKVEFDIIMHNGRENAGNVTGPDGGPVEEGEDPGAYGGYGGQGGGGGYQGGNNYGGGNQGGGNQGEPNPAYDNPDRKKGTIKKWTAKGFGFISCDDGVEYFVHFRDIAEPAGCKAIRVGSQVEFDLKFDKGRENAGNVTGPGGRPVEEGDDQGGYGGGYGGGRGGGYGGGRGGWNNGGGYGGGGRGRGGYNKGRGGYGGGGGYNNGGYNDGGYNDGGYNDGGYNDGNQGGYGGNQGGYGGGGYDQGNGGYQGNGGGQW